VKCRDCARNCDPYRVYQSKPLFQKRDGKAVNRGESGDLPLNIITALGKKSKIHGSVSFCFSY
jgi:hypothetical protein